jgi:hypothetical protein
MPFIPHGGIGGGGAVAGTYRYVVGANGKLQLWQGNTMIQEQNDEGAWIASSIKTGTGSLHIGDLHSNGSGGENVIWLNTDSDIAWYPPWAGVKTDGSEFVGMSARSHGAKQTAEPNGAVHASIAVDYNATFTASADAAFYGIEIVPTEAYKGRCLWTATKSTGKEVAAFYFDCDSVAGTAFSIPFIYPLWVKSGQSFTTTIKKNDGTILKVRAGQTNTAQPYRKTSFSLFKDEGLVPTPKWDKSKTYFKGDMVVWEGMTAVANCDIPAGSEFSWGLESDTTQTMTITGVTKGATTVITCNNSLDTNECSINISGVAGMTQLNGSHIIKTSTATTIEIYTNSTGFSDYVSGGTARVLSWSQPVQSGRTWAGPYSDKKSYAANSVIGGWARARTFIAVRASTTAGPHNNPYNGDNRLMWREFNNENKFNNLSGLDFTVGGNPSVTTYRDMILVSHGSAGTKNVIGRYIPWIVRNQDEADRLCAFFLQKLAVFFKNFDNDIQADPLISAMINNSSISSQLAHGAFPCVTWQGYSDMDNQRVVSSTVPKWNANSEWYELLVARTPDENPTFYTMWFCYAQYSIGTSDPILAPFRLIYQTTRGETITALPATDISANITGDAPKTTARSATRTSTGDWTVAGEAFPIWYEPVQLSSWR